MVPSGSSPRSLDQNTLLGPSTCQSGPGGAEVDVSFGYEYIECYSILPQGMGVDAFHAESDVADKIVGMCDNERESL